MRKYDVIIIGAGPAGIITGTTAKKKNPDKSMLMIKEEENGLVPCGIPYIFHRLGDVDKNKMGPKPFVDAGGDVITDSVEKVNIEKKTVQTKSGKEFHYEKLVFATGSLPVIPTFIPGYDFENVFYIKKSYNYIKQLIVHLKDKKNIIIVGGGFIGAEVAEQLALEPNKEVSLVEMEEFCFIKAFSAELSEIATEKLRKTNVNVYTSTRVNSVNGKGRTVEKVELSNGKSLDADAVIMAIGYKPNTELAREAGLDLNRMSAIIVDNYERTSIKDVCAVGDCSQTVGFLTGTLDNIMLASTATAEARVLGHNLFGIKVKKCFTGTLAVFSTEINGLAMAAAGLNENNAKEANIEFISAKFTDVDRHPGTFEDTMPLTVKLYVSPSDGSILGGEVWGSKSSGEIINTISLAIQKGVTVYELISYQIGTHPLLTAAPTKTVLIKAAEMAIAEMNARK
ncbi:MAG: FAD-dependent oxidoreductase [Bacteroidales bacterium]|nr:FAD-dependent oxidoreductase [Bacteroidales bacterium]MCF8386756.1 FAD-dependent oxidoreductase [Bacteroidales bacterium]MCF8398975.1 FAD-dependent oxidoreductase [Bacteroidales bacterium]